MDFLTMLGFAVVAGIIIAIVQGINTSEKKKDMLSEIEKLDDFEASQQIMGDDGASGLAIDETRIRNNIN